MKKRILYGNLFFLGLSSVVLLFVTFSFFIAIFNKSAEKELVAMGQELSTQVERTLSGLLSDHLRAVAEEAVQLATEQQRRYQAGLTSESAARQGLLDVLASRRIGRNGYVFVLTAKGFVELHPEQNLVGREIEQIEQFRKTQPLTDRLRTIHPGYIEYDWQPLQGAGNRPKALYLEHFRPWDWLIAVSCYRDEVLDLVKPEALNTMMRAFRYGRNGHAVLMDDQGRMLTRPTDHDDDNAKLAEILAELVRRTDGPPLRKISLAGSGQGETGERTRLLHTRSIPHLGLVVGLVADKTNPASGLFSREMLVPVTLVGASLLAVLIGALLISRQLTAPISRLATELRLPDQDTPPYTGGCELDFLLNRFARALDTIHKANEKANSEQVARESAEHFLQVYKQIFDNAIEGMIIADAAGKILAVNSAFTVSTGYTLQEVMGGDPGILKSDRNDRALYEDIWRQLKESGAWEGELWARRKDGNLCPLWLTISTLRGGHKQFLCYFASFSEIGELKKKEKQIAFMAYHDMLTRLPNRSFLEQKLVKSMAQIQAEGGKLALFFIDLDNFKNVNDVFGHKFGDDILESIFKWGIVISKHIN